MSDRIKLLSTAVLLSNALYLWWFIFNVESLLGYVLLCAEYLIVSLTALFIVNNWSQWHIKKKAAVLLSASLDIFITVVDESIDMVETTLKAALSIEYNNKRIYMLDDGGRSDVSALCSTCDVTYLSRGNKQNYKAGNLNFGLHNSSGEYILVLDADQVADPLIARDVLGYFEQDKAIAFIATRQKFDVPEGDFNHDVMFYEHIQAGKNANNAAISCGSGVFYRRSSLETIGGFQTWNIVEDLYTSYIFHSKSFKGIYINKPYTIGIAPRFLRTVYKQRGTWALDTLRIFFRKSPLFYPGLTFRQRLHYIEIGWAYIVSAVAIPTLILVPIVSLFTHKAVLSNEGQYFVFRIPSLIAIVYYYYILNDRSFETGRYWAALWPAYLKALFVSLIPHRKKYSVTRKNEFEIQNGIFFVIPHIVLITLMFVALMWRAYQDGGITLFTVVNCVWFALITFWFLPVIRRGIFGKSGKQDREVPEQLAPVYSGVQPTSFSLENSAARFWAGRYAAK